MSASRPSADDRPARLSAADAETLAVYVAELSAAGAPLAPGLRAAADEAGGRLAAALVRMADALDRGESLEAALGAPAVGFPRYLQGLIRAALASGQLGETLIDLVEHRRAASQQWRSIRSALSYPLLLFALTAAMFLLAATFISPIMRSMMEDFELELPLVARWIIAVGYYGPATVIGIAAAAVVVALVVRFGFGAAAWRRLLGEVPLFGPLWQWTGAAEMSRAMAALVKRRVPLPDALRLTAAGVEDANVAKVCAGLAEQVAEGRDLATLIAASNRLPMSLAPLLRWGQATDRLDEAFLAAAELLEGRVRLRAALLRAILPPFVFLAAAALALMLFVGFFGPTVGLIESLI